METRCKTKKVSKSTEIYDDNPAPSPPSTQISSHEEDPVIPAAETVDLSLILRELRDFRRDNKTQLEDIKAEISNTNARLEEAEGRIVTAEERIQNAEEVLTAMLKMHSKMEEKLVDIEGRSRRNNVRIYGVPEGAEKDSPTMTVFLEKLLRENLHLPGDAPFQIERAHRSLGKQPPADAQPRSIVVKFLSFTMKEQIVRQAWQMRGFSWQGKQINLDNDYAPQVLQMRREYAEIRKVLKDSGVKFRTLFPARLMVMYEDGTKTYNTVEEATQDMAKRGLPVQPISQPGTLMEQIQRMTWQRGGRSKGIRDLQQRRGPTFREKLQTFRRKDASS